MTARSMRAGNLIEVLMEERYYLTKALRCFEMGYWHTEFIVIINKEIKLLNKTIAHLEKST